MPQNSAGTFNRRLEIGLRLVVFYIDMLDLHDIEEAVACTGPWRHEVEHLRKECAKAGCLIASNPRRAYASIARLAEEITLLLVKYEVLPESSVAPFFSGMLPGDLH